MSSDYVPSVLRQNWQVLRVENLQGQRKSYIGFPIIDATSPYTHKDCSDLLNTFARGDVCSAFHCSQTRRTCQGHFQCGSLLLFCFDHKNKGRLNWEKEHIPNRWPPGPKV